MDDEERICDKYFPFGPPSTSTSPQASLCKLKTEYYIQKVKSHKCFGGFQNVYSHTSRELKCEMRFAVYLPPQARFKDVPVIYWLSGVHCTEQDFVKRSGVQRYAAEQGLMCVCPDTIPRCPDPEGSLSTPNIGDCVGFYVDATTDTWKNNFRMYTYVTKELPAVINANFRVIPGKQSIMGRCMGGHGALICALRNPGMYMAVSAFTPICHPSKSPWGVKAFTDYLGPDPETWKEYDATYLVKKYKGPPLEIFIDQSKEDELIEEDEFRLEDFVEACVKVKMPLIAQIQKSYDQTFYFVSTFIGKHVEYHANCFKGDDTMFHAPQKPVTESDECEEEDEGN